MKRQVIFFIALAVAVVLPMAVSAKKKADGKAQIAFSEYSYDFGDVNEMGGPISHDFLFTNTGTGNLVIIDATASCGCTRPEYPKKAIAPGKSGKIKVTYNPAGRPGGINRTVTVRTNGSPSKVRLKINGKVIPRQSAER